MSPTSHLATRFLFVGNGPYRNRGCEAIVRGTMAILSDEFGPDVTAQAGVMAAPTTVAPQQAAETDRRVTNFAVSHVGARLSRKWWMAQADKRLGTQTSPHLRDLAGRFDGARAALQLGGDNYSLDYGRPSDHMAIDRFLLARGIPVVLWGASVGPFDTDPAFAPVIHDHLRRLTAIFVRETASQTYLARHGVAENVHLVADPAFVMAPMAPRDPAVRAMVRPGSIGINISPLVARFSDAGSVAAWRDRAAAMILAVAQSCQRPILLVPHVGSPKPDEDDYAFMASLRDMVAPAAGVPVDLVPPLSAAELKWLIARCDAFAGARTHATIAALSSGVPTLSLGYSIKAVGINQDIFGHQDFCQAVRQVTAADVARILSDMLRDGDAIRTTLAARLPEIRNRARQAGKVLRQITEGQG